MTAIVDNDGTLILAAEEFPPDQFRKLHRFSQSDERLIGKLIAPGPVLLRGGRGSGKSALLIEAKGRLFPSASNDSAFGVYLSLRHLELLRGAASQYEGFLCELIIREVQLELERAALDIEPFDARPTVSSIQHSLSRLSSRLRRRIVLLFDDAAHIGREASLSFFFDIFRTISSGTVSCKAAIYPGVTKFGTRFDVYNDATVLDISRNEQESGFKDFFFEVMRARFPDDLGDGVFNPRLPPEEAANFLGQAVLGNVRAFVFACNALIARRSNALLGISHLSETLLELARNHFWPLLEELAPKLGMYEPLVNPTREIAGVLFSKCGQSDGRRYALVLRETVDRLAKPMEILEYAGFVSKREVSRSMKSGGRGASFALNLCNLLENTPGSRLTESVFQQWLHDRLDPVEFHRGSDLAGISLPKLVEDAEPAILSQSVDILAKSNAYPYGLTTAKINLLKESGILTVGELAAASDERLLSLRGVGEAFLTRFRNIVGQAIWM